MDLELKSPLHERAVVHVPVEISHLSGKYNGVLSSTMGDEYPVKNNIIDFLKDEPGFESLAQSSSQWRVTATLYDEIWRNQSLSVLSGNAFPAEKELKLLNKWVNPRPEKLYLDFGCSTALYARTLKKAEKKATVVGIDSSFEMLKEARAKAGQEGTDLFLIRADGRELPFYSQSFDAIVAGGLLNEITDRRKALYEIRRCLKESGVLFVMHLTQAGEWIGRALQKSISLSGLSFLSAIESKQLFESIGFRIAEQQEFGIVCFTKLTPV